MKNTEQLLDLQAYVDGELSEERRRQIEATLPADLDAQKLVAGLQQLGSLIRAHEPVATVSAPNSSCCSSTIFLKLRARILSR